ncbi:hypothetical protein D3C74_144670 [compost metagenome]
MAFGGPGGFFDFISEVPLFFIILGVLLILFVLGVLIYITIKSLYIWMSNNAAEIVQKSCKVVDKRTEIWGGGDDSSTNTNYYITFEFEDDSSRIELYVKYNHYGLISVGDRGMLTYQGTRFKDFHRRIESRNVRFI